MKYWIGQTVSLGFSTAPYENTWMTFSNNPVIRTLGNIGFKRCNEGRTLWNPGFLLACSCHPEHAEDCEQGSGRCNCRPNFRGDHCEECAAGYYHFPVCSSKSWWWKGRPGSSALTWALCIDLWGHDRWGGEREGDRNRARKAVWGWPKIHSCFSIRCYRKTQMNFWANPYLCESVSQSLEHYIYMSMLYSIIYLQRVRLYHRHDHLIRPKGQILAIST